MLWKGRWLLLLLLAVSTAVRVEGRGGSDYRDSSYGKNLVNERPLTGRRGNRRQPQPSFTDSPGDGNGSDAYPHPSAHSYPSRGFEPDERARAQYYDDEYSGATSTSSTGRGAAMRPGNDVTHAYTASLASRLLVAVSSGVCMTIAASFALMSFSKGEVAELSKAMGVFFILVLKQSHVANAVVVMTDQVKAALSLAGRKPFPPVDNPWSYVHDPEQPGSIQFKMINCLLGIIFGGAFCGWSLARSIPFFPGWLGALSLASCCGYLGTIRDPRGDLLRYIGYSIQATLGYINSKADDVQLRDKAGVVFSTVFAVLLRIEKQYNVVAKLSLVLKTIIESLSALLKRVQSDMDGKR